jgi:hypothetical protein
MGAQVEREGCDPKDPKDTKDPQKEPEEIKNQEPANNHPL